jgi:regulator of RNase E activity RraA
MTGPDLERLAAIGTATLSAQLIKHGLRSVWMAGPKPLAPGRRIAGPAFTLRFLPQREDVATFESYTLPGALVEAIEAAPAGAVVVADTRGAQGGGVIGDIYADRLRRKGVRGFVTDGAVRDLAGLGGVDFPIWCTGLTAPPSIGALWFAGWGEAIGCGGVLVFPEDLIVADDDGAIVVPRALVQPVLGAAIEQDRFERFVQARVAAGHAVTGLYPPTDPASLEAYQRWQEEEGR